MIYVDELTTYLSCQVSSQAKKYGLQWCHIFADSVDELHKMADLIGLKRKWFQNKKNFPHYDIIASKRQQALWYGAQEVKLKEFLKKKMLEKTNI
jgi:hypothetical protein